MYGKRCEVSNKWETEVGIPSLFRVGRNDAVVSAEVTRRETVEVELKLITWDSVGVIEINT